MTTGFDRLAYDDALALLWERIDYERASGVVYGESEYKLDRMRELLARLGNPQSSAPIVHVAGTKGKGSTAAMTAAVLSAAGYRTGLFSSPHLKRVEERMAIDGQLCPEAEFLKLARRLRPIVADMDAQAARTSGEVGPTYFELTTAVALLHFATQQVDAMVLEVGMGGRLDSTNVCSSTVSVITSISFDHTRQLGHTLALIAREKAGIIKPGVPVVSGVVADEPRGVIEEVSQPAAVADRAIGTRLRFRLSAAAATGVGTTIRPAGLHFDLTRPAAPRTARPGAGAARSSPGGQRGRGAGGCRTIDDARILGRRRRDSPGAG